MKKIKRGIFSIVMLIVVLGLGSVGAGAKKKAKPSLNYSRLTLTRKQTKKLKIKKIKAKRIKKLTFRSSNPKIVSVNKKGKVKAKKAGNAKIICRIKLKNGKKYVLKCKIKVKKSPSNANTALPAKTPSSADVMATASPDSETLSSATEAPDAVEDSSATAAPTSQPSADAAEEHLSKNGITTIDNGQMRSDMTAFEIQHAMGLGINLGNTMEACGSWINSSSVTNYETAWCGIVTTQEMISGMKDAGFSSIRIPVAWSNMMSEDGEYTISDEYFDRVETIMNYAFNERMYVIINIHYDSGWWATFGSQDEEERTAAMEKYKAMWTQIANRYEEYSDYLIFESANEELGTRLNSTDDYENSGYYTTEEELYDLTNEINQTFVDIVRQTGGNNASRHLLIAGYDTDISKTCSSSFKMPEDTIEEHLMVSVHYYSPYGFCLVSSEENTSYQASWGTEEEIAVLQSDLQNMKINFTNKGIPVVIGEYGVCNTETEGGSSERKSGRDIFFQTICEYAVNNGMCPMLWDTNVVYNRSSCSMSNETEAANYLALAEMISGIATYEPEETDGTYIWNGTVGCSGWNPISPVSSKDSSFSLTGLGGCYQISGVDWSAYTNPVFILHSDELSGSTTYKLALEVNTDNQYYNYIENAVKSGTWNFSDDITVDLSDIGLAGTENLYLSLTGSTDFEGSVTFTIREKG